MALADRLGAALSARAERVLATAQARADLLVDVLDLPPVTVALGDAGTEFDRMEGAEVAGCYLTGPARIVLDSLVIGADRDPIVFADLLVIHEIAHHLVASRGLDDSDDVHGPTFRQATKEVGAFTGHLPCSEDPRRAVYWPRPDLPDLVNGDDS